ncbi:uncharacterized protein EI90DRAFT_589842 [Cantharellus anzutake]|uniref:uncharacterized protein n=1 Tax=Cantharellus anzutake TaxID=1750568 RepID=UPI0019053036|nr:uncharacterized protein EI90DRAFT_589842 [Cantharellus anzutake]KAF8333644.1 hypothetical protein EI90DRAFT_589842 [Cantharellus anzutake]
MQPYFLGPRSLIARVIRSAYPWPLPAHASSHDPFADRPPNHLPLPPFLPRSPSAQLFQQQSQPNERIQPDFCDTRLPGILLPNPQAVRAPRANTPIYHAPSTRPSSYPSIPDVISQLPPLTPTWPASRGWSTHIRPPSPARLRGIRLSSDSHGSSPLPPLNTQDRSPDEGPEDGLGFMPNTSESSASSGEREYVSSPVEENQASTSEQGPSTISSNIQTSTGVCPPRRRKTSSACHFCRREPKSLSEWLGCTDLITHLRSQAQV